MNHHIWAKDGSGEGITLRQRIRYGDSAGLTDPHLLNLNGQLVTHHDEAGKATITGYDFKGNPLEKVRKVLADTELSGTTKYVIDWTGLIETILDPKEYATGLLYDGLNRVRKSIYPAAVDNTRKELVPTYNNAGALEKVALDGTEYVKHIAYNAKGQRLLLAMGNSMMTRYAYDEVNYRLLRIRSEKYTESTNTFTANGGVQQDLGYLYDLAGNIIGIRDKAPATSGTTGAEGPGDLLKVFSYDPLNRLLTATGRESTAPAVLPTWDEGVRGHDHTATNTYTRTYSFDKLGNVLQEQHTADGNPSNSFTKTFNYHPTQEHNKLLSFEVGAITYAHTYDATGNLLTETTSRHHQWGYDDKLKLFKIDGGGGASIWANYMYDTGGSRVKKVVNKPGGIQEVTICIDGVFEECYTKNSGTIDSTRHYNTLHVLDGNSRLVTVRIGTDVNDATPVIKYNLEDHLGNSSVLVDDTGQLVNREEYYPFGDTSFGAFAKKIYRYNGKQKDNESGLYNYGMRFYAPWICKFISCDPLSAEYPHYTPYQYAGNKPINFVDLDGLEEGEAKTGTLNVTIYVRPDANDAQPMSEQQYLNWYTNAINDINATWNAGNLKINGVNVNTGGVNFASAGPNFDPKSLGDNEVLFTVGNGGSLFQKGSGFSSGEAQVFKDNTISFVNKRNQTANFGTGYFFAANQGSDAGHEFGHLFGISDRYHNATTYANDGAQNSGTDVLAGRATVPMILPKPDRDTEYDPLDNLYSGPGSRVVTQNQLGYMFGLNRRKYERDYPSVILVNNSAGSSSTNYTQVQVKNTWLFHRKVTQAIANNGQGGAPTQTSVIHWARSIAWGFRVVDQGNPDIVNRALRVNTWNQRDANRNLIRAISR